MANELQGPEPKMDTTNLYREEIITDRRVGTIRVLTPITASGAADPKRKVLYVGETQVLTAGGMLPIAFELDAASLGEAIEKFAEGVKRAVEETIQEIQQLRREAASSIVIPDVKSASGLLGGPGALGGPGGPGGPPRGGRIQLP
jgi:hypothetical protein